MKKTLQKFTIPPEKVSPVPKADTDRLKQAVRERVIQPMEERAKRQRQLIATVRARPVR
jgi:hypothetical protein